MFTGADATIAACGRRVAEAALGIVTGLAAVPAFAETSDPRAWLLGIAPSIVKVEAYDVAGTYSLGTGVTVAPGRVVTNCHVTRKAQRITLVQGALRTPATRQLADVERDLCLLDAPRLAATPVVSRSATTLRVGQRVRALGFTGGVELARREGFVGALHRFDGSQVIQSTTAFTSGASGGGLFDDDGRLVGILTFRLPGAPASYFSVPVDWIAAGVAANSDRFVAVAPLDDGTPFWQRPAGRLPFFMRAARLAAGGDWPTLLELADEWAAAEADNPEPWLFRGKALLRLDRYGDAAPAFEQAVALAPTSAEALHGLGVAYLRLGQSDNLQRVHARLDSVDPELADHLAAVGGFFRNRRGL